MTLIEKIFRKTDDYVVTLASTENMKQDCPAVNIPLIQLWNRDTTLNKLKAILRCKYHPRQELIQQIAREIFFEEFFGSKDDLAEPLLELMVWHQNRNWCLLNLENSDSEKANALEAMTHLSRKRYWEYTSPALNLQLIYKQPIIVPLIYPIVAKIPVRSIQYFIDIHSRYAFDRIRRSKHQFSDEIISYLYEVLILNQKVANRLHFLIKYIDDVKLKKKEIIMHKSEIDSTSEIDLIVIYLKAMVEKIISLVGYTFGIKNLESKKEHKKRVILLIKHLPEKVKLLTYYEFLIEQLSANQLEKLNNYRTGILHKKGIAKNQPQEFYATNDGYKTLVEMFQFLFEQHCKNSLVLIASAALLTDELVKLDKPKFELIEIPIQSLLLELKEIQTRINL